MNRKNAPSLDLDEQKLCYCDLAAKEDSHLRLVASLLLATSESLEPFDQKLLGELITDYLNRKCMIDHHFWGRELVSVIAEQEQISAWLSFISTTSRV